MFFIKIIVAVLRRYKLLFLPCVIFRSLNCQYRLHLHLPSRTVFCSMPIQLPTQFKQPNDDWVISYRIIRIVVGWLGIGLPVICVLGTWLLGHCAYNYQRASLYFSSAFPHRAGIVLAMAVHQKPMAIAHAPK